MHSQSFSLFTRFNTFSSFLSQYKVQYILILSLPVQGAIHYHSFSPYTRFNTFSSFLSLYKVQYILILSLPVQGSIHSHPFSPCTTFNTCSLFLSLYKVQYILILSLPVQRSIHAHYFSPYTRFNTYYIPNSFSHYLILCIKKITPYILFLSLLHFSHPTYSILTPPLSSRFTPSVLSILSP